LEEKMKELLTKYQLPKMVFSVGTIPLTETGKINRAGCRQLAATYQVGR
jgi:O-succinylbenzoic acid--CoA ligase